jgi:hypothetical protein
MTANRYLVAVPATLSAGMFSDERTFEVQLANGQTYVGLAPRYFCWDASGKLVGEKAPPGEVPGLVAAKLVDELDGGQVAVEVPDGTVIAVKEEQAKDRPTPILPPGHRSTV